MESAFLRRLETYSLPFIFLLAFAFFLTGLNPTFYVDDSPETITACVLLGIPHPPGYPLHTLLGHFFSWLPLAQYPFRINLFSALLAALVCVALYGFLKNQLKLSARLAVPFALLWMVGGTTYPAALSAKTGIYQLTALFLLAILWALFEKRLPLAAFLLGLSLANHWMSMLTFLPGFGILACFQWKEEGIEKPRIYQAICFLLLGLSVYLFLPLRAFQNPWLNWGNPSTLHNFISDFLRNQYSNMGGGAGLAGRFQQAWVFLKSSFLEFGGLLAVALWGWWKVYQKNKPWALALGVLWLGLVGVVVFVLGMPEDQYYLIQNYVIPVQLFTILFSAWGLQNVLAEKEEASRQKTEKILVGAIVLLLAGLGGWRLSQERQTGYTYDYDYVLNGLKSLPKNTLYFCKGDSVVFPCWYFQWIENKRPDLGIFGLNGLPMEWIRQNTALYHSGLKVPKTSHPVGLESIPTMAKWIVDQNPFREVYLSYNDPNDTTFPGMKMIPYGLGGKGFWGGQEPVLDEAKANFIWDGLRLRHLRDKEFPVDGRTQSLIVRDYAVFRNSLGVYYEDLGDRDKAAINPHSKAADLLQMDRYYDKCLEEFKWAAEWAPQDAQFHFNLGNAYVHLGRLQDAMVCYEKATGLNPRYTNAYFNWAVITLQSGDRPKAKELFGKVLETDPANAQAKRGLDMLRQMGN